MAKKIKLENIVSDGFSRTTGQPVKRVTNEYVCDVCRHLVELADNFCWHCGNELLPSDLTEHWYKEKKLSDAQFMIVKNLNGKELRDFVDKIAPPPNPYVKPAEKKEHGK